MLTSVTRLILAIFLLLAPIAIPLLSGTIAGILWGFWSNRQVWQNTDKFLYETKDILNDWGLGGEAPTFREFQDTHNDFHILRINTHDWLEKLGFILPKEYTKADENGGLEIDKLANLDILIRDVNVSPCREREHAKESWLYLTNSGWPSINEWDAAFDEIVQRAYVDPKLNQSGVFFAECARTAGFLCGIWSTRSPALVHFVVEDHAPAADSIDESLTYAVPTKQLRPVTARIIEFPLKEEYTGLSTSLFPSPKEQMLAIVTGDRLYEQFEPHVALEQTFKRFNEYIHVLWNVKGTFLYYMSETNDWLNDHIYEPLGVDEYVTYLDYLAFGIAANVSMLIIAIAQAIGDLIAAFLGRPLRGDWIMGDLSEYDLDKTPEERAFDGLFGEFWKDMDREIANDPSILRKFGATNTITAA